MATALPFISAGLIIGGTLLSAQAQKEAGEEAEAAAKANALQAAENARIVRAEGRKRAARAVRGGERLKSTQRAAFGKSGVLLTGSAQEILAETDRVTAEDVEAILTASETGQAEFLFEASQRTRQAKAAARAAKIAPLATLVSGAGKAAIALQPAFQPKV
ncbi:hypothetical protein LCGC14_1948910 [marine sediment metagenome]|uniref:Uncharacterized protein n=1 Tax=marine sediment metagenome TaxID=412755 RepID=A0A0F9FHZ0_9ZZZZ